MRLRLALVWAALGAVAFGQARQQPQRPVRLAARGTRGAVAAGSEYATEAGMRMYTHGGTAIDAGVASMLAASVVEFSHFGLGGEAPILVRTKDGKVHAIAGVGTMPKLATAQFFRDHKITDEEMLSPPETNGMKNWVPVAGILPALVPGMVKPPWSHCVSTAPNPSPKSCSPPSTSPMASPSTRCAPTPSPTASSTSRHGRTASAPSSPMAARPNPATFSGSPIWPARCAPWPKP